MIVVPQRAEGEELLAGVVIILPQDFDPAQPFGVRGLLTNVDLAAD